MPSILQLARDGGEPDESVNVMIGLAVFAVAGLALVGLILSIVGTVLSQKKLMPAFGIVLNIMPPFTYILVCILVGAYMGATGQM